MTKRTCVECRKEREIPDDRAVCIPCGLKLAGMTGEQEA